jgi:hypothetical protein
MIEEGNGKRVDCDVHDWEWGHFKKKDRIKGGKLVDWESLFWVDIEWMRSNVIQFSCFFNPILLQIFLLSHITRIVLKISFRIQSVGLTKR